MVSNWIRLLVCLALVLVNAADLSTTLNSEPANEGNPLARVLWSRFGPASLLVLKIGTVGFMLAWLEIALRLPLGLHWDKVVWVVFVAHLLIVGFIALRNYVILTGGLS
jgi:hypothetical protein